MKETAQTNAAGENGVVNIKSLVFEYLIHWPFILLSMVACMAGAWLYLRYQAPVYNVSATVLIKQGDRNRCSHIKILKGNTLALFQSGIKEQSQSQTAYGQKRRQPYKEVHLPHKPVPCLPAF